MFKLKKKNTNKINYRSLEDCATIPIKMSQKYIDKLFYQQMTFFNVFQNQTEFVKIRCYNYNSLNSQVTKCDAFVNAKDYR